MRTSFIHVGTHKTSTTSIQIALNSNRELLERHGILYPRGGIPPSLAGHHKISSELYTAGPEDLSDCTNIDALLEEIRSSNHDVVISAEGLSCAIYNEERFWSFIRRLKQLTPRIVVIAYVRNQVDYAPSLYLTLLQFGYRETFDTFLDAGLRDRFFSFDTLRFPFCYRGSAMRFYCFTVIGSVICWVGVARG